MAENTKRNTALEFVSDNAELDALRKEKDELERTIKRQRMMMLDSVLKTGSDPFVKAVTDEEIPFIERIKEIRDKFVSSNITQSELHEMYTAQNRILELRKVKLDYEDRGTIDKMDSVAKTWDEKRILDTKVPPGYRGYWEFDTPSLGGSRVRRLLNLGWRFMRNNGMIHCEADGEVWNPECKSSIVYRVYGTFGANSEPMTHYLMVIDETIENERRRIKSDRTNQEKRGNIEDSLNEVKRIIQSTGMELSRDEIRISG